MLCIQRKPARCGPRYIHLVSTQYELRFAVWRPETAAGEAENGGVSATFSATPSHLSCTHYEADSFHYTKNPLKSKYMEVIFGQDELTQSGIEGQNWQNPAPSLAGV